VSDYTAITLSNKCFFLIISISLLFSPAHKCGALCNGDVLFVCSFVCRLWNLLSHSLHGSTCRRAGAFRIVSDTLFKEHYSRCPDRCPDVNDADVGVLRCTRGCRRRGVRRAHSRFSRHRRHSLLQQVLETRRWICHESATAWRPVYTRLSHGHACFVRVFNRHTLVCKSVILGKSYIDCCVLFCLVTDISATVGTDRREIQILHNGACGPGQIFSHLGGGNPGIPKSEIFGLNFENLYSP